MLTDVTKVTVVGSSVRTFTGCSLSDVGATRTVSETASIVSDRIQMLTRYMERHAAIGMLMIDIHQQAGRKELGRARLQSYVLGAKLRRYNAHESNDSMTYAYPFPATTPSPIRALDPSATQTYYKHI